MKITVASRWEVSAAKRVFIIFLLKCPFSIKVSKEKVHCSSSVFLLSMVCLMRHGRGRDIRLYLVEKLLFLNKSGVCPQTLSHLTVRGVL